MTDLALSGSADTVRTSLPVAGGQKSRAHGFFWTVLAVAATVSITGNATQALLHDTALPVVAAAVAIIPPLALLAAVHGVTVLARAHTASRIARWVATSMTGLIAAGAFWLSFTALRSLAITAGVPDSEAWIWPLIIEGSMTQATVALLALAHSVQGDPCAHTTPATDTPSPRNEEPPTEPTPPVQAHSVHIATVRTQTPPSDGSDHDFSAVAAQLCARDPARRRDPDLVAKALARHYVDGWNPTRIATELNKSRSTISRILSDAAAFEGLSVTASAGV